MILKPDYLKNVNKKCVKIFYLYFENKIKKNLRKNIRLKKKIFLHLILFKMLTKLQIKNYNEKGYVKFKYPVKQNLINFKNEFAQQILVSIKDKISPNKINLNTNNKLDQIIHKGMITLDKIDHKFLVEIYNSLPRSVSFYKVISDPKMVEIVNQLLGNKKNRNLYINSN